MLLLSCRRCFERRPRLAGQGSDPFPSLGGLLSASIEAVDVMGFESNRTIWHVVCCMLPLREILHGKVVWLLM
ncbi:hypothetical protein B2D07_10355 [Desulfococcus multivorans]|nr:hypothetical protein B2D07_10355 [Desulfococcus multivorans]